jgi:hypothetical protein
LASSAIWALGLGDAAIGQPAAGRAACSGSSRTRFSRIEAPDALLERRVPGSDPLRAVLGPFVYQLADLAYEGRDPVAPSADLGAGGVHGRLGRHTG